MEYIKVYHKLEIINNKRQFVIYADYPFEYEFGLDFNNFKIKSKMISNKIKEYTNKNLSSFKNATVLLVLNGVIIGSFIVAQVLGSNVKSSDKSEDNIIKSSIIAKTDDVIQAEESNELENKENEKEEVVELKNEDDKLIVSSANENTNVTEIVKKSNSNNNVNVASVSNNSNQSQQQTSTSVGNTNNSTQEKTIKLKLNSGNVIDISLEDYVIGVVSSEMPALFNSEALKAQAVATRTFGLKKNDSGAVLTTTTADQVYKTNDELKVMWGSSYNTYYNKVKSAVLATQGEVLTYNGKYIDALYFSTSNGRTEDPIYVWKYTAPYLKSVECKWDTGVNNFSTTKTISMSEISKKLDVTITDISQISINSITTGGRVNSVTFAGKEFSGVQIRSLLGLRSADFSLSQSGDNIVFTTKGYGHGVGMSQYGANEMAKSGYSYNQILKYFYTGVTIVKK